ncbi:hypothetical protein WKW79_15225 [Variovorax robiniae]|uniref:Uncharacterized protein n=1 Tax=Variovorax robiniae TaxID=1836199 RepID=A0ABU8X7X1_9BURK
MNVAQSSMAIATHGNRKGQVALVLWQEQIHACLGLIWRVRFQAPQLSTRISDDGGATFHDGVSFSREALMPDAWLREVEWQRTITPLEIELHRPVAPPEVIEVQLRWPDGWLNEVQSG